MKGLTELQETKELWNLGDCLENVCNSVMRKLHHAGYVLEERNRWDGGCSKERERFIRDALEELPSAQPERKKGQWEEKEVIRKGEAQSFIEEWQSARCSHCGKYHTTPYLYYFDEYAYCPHCGADMRGKTDDTEK